MYCGQGKINLIEQATGPIRSTLLVQLYILSLHGFGSVILIAYAIENLHGRGPGFFSLNPGPIATLYRPATTS